jgi:alkylhydroperoxidase family enzyme
MSWIVTIDEHDAGEELAPLYEQMVDPQSGRVDNILRIHGLHPAGLEAHFRLYRAVMRSTPALSKVDREMIALVVSRINDCHY